MEYKRIEIDLSEARENKAVDFGGYFTSFMIVKSDEEFEYRINSNTAEALYSEELQGFEGSGVFSRVYITNEAGEGKAVFVVYK